MEGKVGFGFRPTDDELVGYFLLNKIGGNTRLVESINEVDICSFDPWELRLQAKIKSRDPVWYFFSRRGKKYASGNQQSRKTSSGFWKLTGDPVDVKDHWGTWCGIPGKIGQKRVLGFHRGTTASSKSKGMKSDWVMHEYHYTLLSEDARTYVICRLEYKGDDRNMLTDNAIKPTPTFVANVTHSAGSVIDQSLQGNSGSYNTFAEYDPANQGQHFNGFFNMQQSLQGNSGSYNILSEYDSANQDQLFSGNFNIQQSVQGNSGSLNHFSESEYDIANQVPWFSGNFSLPQHVPYSAQYEDESEIWKNLVEQNYDALVDERTLMQENCNDYRPKNPVTGVLADDSSDSDTDSMICGDAWSSADSVDSSNGPYQTPIDDLLSLSTIKPLQPPKPLKLQIKEKVINKQKKECECKMDEDSIKKTSSANTVNENWIVLEEMNQRNSQWIYFKNMIIGFLLFISIIGWIILVA